MKETVSSEKYILQPRAHNSILPMSVDTLPLNSAIRRLGVCKWTADIRVQLYYTSGDGMGRQRSTSPKFWSKRQYFYCLLAAKGAGYSRYSAVSTRVSNFVGLCWSPILSDLWRCEPGFTIYTSKLCIQGAPLRFTHRKSCFIKNGKTYRLQNFKVYVEI